MIINTKKSGGITPSGSISITENGTYDVTEKAEAVVDVHGGVGGDIDEYVSNGIIRWYDAIKNTRNGHDKNYQGWQDLSGNNQDLVPIDTFPIVGDYFYYFFNGGGVYGNSLVSPPKHIEIVFSNTADLSVLFGTGLAKGEFADNIYKFNNIIGFSTSEYNLGILDDTSNSIISVCANSEKSYVCGSNYDGISMQFDNLDASTRFAIARRYQSTWNSSNIIVCAIRLYDRQLTEAEINTNFIADLKRFGVMNRAVSAEEILNALPTTVVARTITLPNNMKNTLTQSIANIAQQKGWTIA